MLKSGRAPIGVSPLRRHDAVAPSRAANFDVYRELITQSLSLLFLIDIEPLPGVQWANLRIAPSLPRIFGRALVFPD